MVVFNKGLDGFFHSLIPSELQKTLNAHSAEYVRVRALTAVLVISTVVPALGTLFIASYHFLFNSAWPARDWIALALTLLFAIQAGFFYCFGNRWLSAAAFTNIYFILVVVLLLTSGGIASPMKAILLTCPIVSFLIGGREDGLQSTLITMLFVAGLAALSAMEFALPNFLYKDKPQAIFMANWLGTVTITTFCIMVYEAELQSRSEFLHQQLHKTHQGSRASQPPTSFIARFVPEKLRSGLNPGSIDYVRVRTLAIMLLAGTVISLLSAATLVGLHMAFFPSQLKYDLIVLVITVIFATQAWIFYQFSNFWLSSLLFMYFYLIIALVLTAMAGGYDAPLFSLLLISPIVFFMLGGIQQGIQNSVFVALLGTFFGVMDLIGFKFPSVFEAASPALLYGIACEVAIVGVVLCVLVYDTELQNRN